ncbi:hypothetical protein LJR219_000537 [Phenylobacterium sp. LjRoot219]|uniref:hypothetical protein n=1 Tax=Phenylobacterium sp. LjRoot219 TaxID=3342283 RepID=UPI003ED06A59
MAWSRPIAIAAVAAVAGSAAAQSAQKVTGPVATYWMSAQTQSGFGMMGAGGGQPDRGAMMRMMMGGGQGPQHALILQLGSSQKPQGAAEADHLPPAGLRAGAKLPLVTPVNQPAQPVDDTPSLPREYQKPRGRMLIFWGCGERARPNQPVVIDFAKVAAGQMPAGFQAATRGLGGAPMQPPSPGRNATYGEWPNPETRAAVPGNGSLVGEHTVQGSYSPPIRFSLAQDQDFLSPLNLVTNAPTGGGAVQLGWNAVPNATGYFATVIGGAEETVVLWTSAEVQASAFAAPDYLPPAEAAKLVASKALLSPQTTTCAVPKEVVDAAPHALVQLVAYGPEANFIHPPRPSDPKVAWNKEWQVKVRYRSATGGMLGMAAPNMATAADDGAPPEAGQQPKQDKGRKAIMRGLGGALGGALGVPTPGF